MIFNFLFNWVIFRFLSPLIFWGVWQRDNFQKESQFSYDKEDGSSLNCNSRKENSKQVAFGMLEIIHAPSDQIHIQKPMAQNKVAKLCTITIVSHYFPVRSFLVVAKRWILRFERGWLSDAGWLWDLFPT